MLSDTNFSILGLLKIEEEIDQGSFVGLSPKCYSLVGSTFENGNEKMKNKKAHKGIHRETLLDHEDFLNCLYQDKSISKDQFSFRIQNKSKQIDLIKSHKIALNSTYCKFFVENDKVTCTPLKDSKGKFV